MTAAARACDVTSRPARAQSPLRLRTAAPAAAPHFARAAGAYLTDTAGRSVVDFCGGFGGIVLGHAHPAVEAAVHAQWTAPAPPAELERAVADRLRAGVPGAERTRFAARPADLLSVAVALAHTATARSCVILAADEPPHAALGPGPAERMAAISGGDAMRCPAGDAAALERMLEARSGEVAAIIVTPAPSAQDGLGYLRAARRLADRHGALLVFDEVQTGLRVDLGGMQSATGVQADLALFGASLANGYPLAGLCGSVALMDQPIAQTVEPAAGVALAAARIVLDRLERERVAASLQVRGAEVQAEIETLLVRTGADAWVSICGDPTYSLLAAKPYKGLGPDQLLERLGAACLARGVFTLGAHVMSHAHGDAELARLLDAYAEVLPMLTEQIDRAAGAPAAKLGLSAARFRAGAEGEAFALLALAADSGVRLIDTSPEYGEAEAVLGEVLGPSSPIRITTRTIPGADPDAVVRAARASLERLGRPDQPAILARAADLRGPDGPALWARLRRLKDEGLYAAIGFVGCVCDRPLALARQLKPDIVQVPTSLFDQRLVRDGSLAGLAALGVEVRLRTPLLHELSPLRDRLLAEDVDPVRAALGFALGRPETAAAIVSIRSAAELRAAIQAAESPLTLDWEVFAVDAACLFGERRGAAA